MRHGYYSQIDYVQEPRRIVTEVTTSRRLRVCEHCKESVPARSLLIISGQGKGGYIYCQQLSHIGSSRRQTTASGPNTLAAGTFFLMSALATDIQMDRCVARLELRRLLAANSKVAAVAQWQEHLFCNRSDAGLPIPLPWLYNTQQKCACAGQRQLLN